MCFYYDDSDGYCRVYEESIVNRTKKEYRCESCRRTIAIGEQCLKVFYVGDGGPGGYRVCNQCVQDGVTIHRRETKEGCAGHESWCPWDEVSAVINHGNYGDFGDADFAEDRPYTRWRDYRKPALFWPYGAPPAAKTVDLRQIPELERLVKKKPEKAGAK